ncbi:MAG: T9SS type A sorting domain-containing protein [Bacteroidales bacterium]|nr:T9SS type A sorting domain-containing protein [Bacteroidales bacterium]
MKKHLLKFMLSLSLLAIWQISFSQGAFISQHCNQKNNTKENSSFKTKSNPELFFSEYVSGSSYNKALEIYNPTDEDIDLSEYIIRGTANKADKWKYKYEFPKGKKIKAKDVFVIVSKKASDEIKKVADWIDNGYLTGFNGNDARGLFKKSNLDVALDVIGNYNNPKGAYYTVAGVKTAMKYHTILRKPNCIKGNSDWSSSAGTNSENSEWIVKGKDYFSNLGMYGVRNDIIAFSFDKQVSDAIINNEELTVKITVSHKVKTEELKKLIASFTLSEGATAKVNGKVQESGVTPNDFSQNGGKLVYTIISKNNEEQNWTVIVTVADKLSDAKEITNLKLKNILGKATISKDTIVATIKYGTDITKLKPVFRISYLASIADTTKILDFTKPQTYTVTAENKTTKKWVVIIKEQKIIEVKDIATLKKEYKENELFKITREVTFTYATTPQYFIQDKTGAISLYSKNIIKTKYNIGDNIKGVVVKLSKYFGVIQAKPMSDPGTAISSNNKITIPELTIEQYKANYKEYIDKLVKIIKVKFEETGNFEKDTNYTLTNDKKNKLTLRTKFSSADYIGKVIPTKLLNIIAIGGVYNDRAQIYLRNQNDLELLTGINDLILNSTKLYPNPSNGLVTLKINNTKNQQFAIEVYNVIGNLVYQTKTNKTEEKLDLTMFDSGIYYVNINKGNVCKVYKIIIQ